jgi:hypothetical protein
MDSDTHETPQNWTNQHKPNAPSATHNPLVVGSIPTWPTHKFTCRPDPSVAALPTAARWRKTLALLANAVASLLTTEEVGSAGQ